jgi:4a-hydroxytetrahydrobiopterin dehydratase
MAGELASSSDGVPEPLPPVEGWRREGDAMARELRFRDFDSAMRFLERVAEVANDYGRRPDMCISEFNHVRLAISNQHHAGFTLAEARLAGKVNAVIEKTAGCR